MKIVRDEKSGTFTFVPDKRSEKRILASIIKILKPGDKIFYDGRDEDRDGFPRLFFYAGAQKKEKVEKGNGWTSISIACIGGIKLTLSGNTKEDRREVSQIRDACFFGRGELIFIGETVVDEKKAIKVTVRHCKLCKANMINRVACEWGICDACAAKCQHRYISGAIRGGSLDISIGEFCDSCGRGKPEMADENMSQTEHHCAVEK
ncbi:MAG: hypothetical protein PHT40_02865 [Patescibacteria group bacterium]|nr:hypothetical protein [Patescibacteria group bacterium]